MIDALNTVDWDKILLEPQPNWYSKSCPVVSVTVVDEAGNLLEEKLARVSPVHESLSQFPPYGQVKDSRVVTLDYEVGDGGSVSSVSGVEVDVLKIGGWANEIAKQQHVVRFEGFTQDEKYKNVKWSNTF